MEPGENESGIRASSSVRAAMTHFGDAVVGANEFFARLCKQHPDYISNKARELESELNQPASGG